MTDKEYQDKKRECWIECAFGDCNLGDASTPVTVIDTCKQVFDWAFDRAYSLGKQEKDAEDTVISGWVARDMDGDLFSTTISRDEKKPFGMSYNIGWEKPNRP